MKAHITSILVMLFLFVGLQRNYSQSSTIEDAGDLFLIAVPAYALGTTLLKKDKKGAWQFAKSFLLNQAITFTLKQTIDKPRPDLSNNNSFPSGHTSTTFQAASYVHIRYGFKYSIPAYLAAGFTAFSRVDANRHDEFDILAGAIIGIGSSYLFTTPYQKKHLELSYSSLNNSHLIGFKYKF